MICGVPSAVAVPAEQPAIEAAAGRPGRFAIPLQPQVAVLATALALGFGGVIGSALSPGIETLLAAAATAPPATASEEAADIGAGGGEGGSSGSSGESPSADAPSATPTSTTPATTTPTEEPIEEEAPTEEPTDEDPVDDPLPDDDTTLATGTVVRVNPAAQSYSLASGGALSTVHAKQLPDPGAEIEVSVESLFNGTLSEAGERRESGGEKTASFAGTVTFVHEEEPLYVVSSAGASIPVRVNQPGTGKPDLPPLGALITVEVEIGPASEVDPGAAEGDEPGDVGPTTDPAGVDPGEVTQCSAEEPSPAEPIDPEIELKQASYTVDFEELSTARLEGIVQASCPEVDQIVISADDLRETEADLTLTVPKGIDPADVKAGESVTVNANPVPGDDGTLELSGLAGDDGLEDADDSSAGQGDLAE